MSIVLFDSELDGSTALSNINPATFIQPPAYEDGRECSETSAHKIQMPGNNPEESIQHLEHGESLKSRKL